MARNNSIGTGVCLMAYLHLLVFLVVGILVYLVGFDERATVVRKDDSGLLWMILAAVDDMY